MKKNKITITVQDTPTRLKPNNLNVELVAETSFDLGDPKTAAEKMGAMALATIIENAKGKSVKILKKF